jgi:hypothetical protein
MFAVSGAAATVYSIVSRGRESIAAHAGEGFGRRDALRVLSRVMRPFLLAVAGAKRVGIRALEGIAQTTDPRWDEMHPPLARPVGLFRLRSLRRFIQALRSCRAAADDTVDSGDFAVKHRDSEARATNAWPCTLNPAIETCHATNMDCHCCPHACCC